MCIRDRSRPWKMSNWPLLLSRLLTGGATHVADVVLLQLAVERGTIEAQDRGRFLLVPVRPLQRLQDRHLLDLGERPVRREDELRRRARLFAERFGAVSYTHLTLPTILRV